ncbi:MAG: hypothetical protein FWH03_01255 [Firmicutes bacterium]|nr:hypothetical protein [Bacillota bacterium]
MGEKKTKDTLEKALFKRAEGYTAQDEVEEYAADKDGKMQLLKRKVTQYEVPPDITAIKLLLETNKETAVEELTEQQLIAERDRLLKLLGELNGDKVSF